MLSFEKITPSTPHSNPKNIYGTVSQDNQLFFHETVNISSMSIFMYGCNFCSTVTPTVEQTNAFHIILSTGNADWICSSAKRTPPIGALKASPMPMATVDESNSLLMASFLVGENLVIKKSRTPMDI
ncbi:hypothetical protein OGAPHI_000524 [Ogataea philodendri]|uniref:Uncharacterized protein n=1 Tax=Ogataea philodendri TaxID=1378263 RepID=A0A9P8TAP1_9ASCO|nr:uncharacterized protein OGAPHI_000524 [Ogataea philodendri]KAH3671301.1 hypothetical protein OGAPHI_000524 [Ogataea philodendri]